MQDRLEAPPGKISRISNLAPSDNRRQESLLPLSILIVGAVAVAIGLAFDLALVINAGGIPGVFVLPTITKTTEATQVNSVVNKVAAVVDDLAGDEEEYIVEDQAEDFGDEYDIEDNLFEDGGDNDNDDDDNEDKEEEVEEEEEDQEEVEEEEEDQEEEEEVEEVEEAKVDDTEEGQGESEEDTEMVMENSDHAMAEEKKETQTSSDKEAEESEHETEASATDTAEENLQHQSPMSSQESENEEVKEEANQKVESGDQEEERETRKEDDIAAGQTTMTKKGDVAPTSTDEVAVTSSSTWIETGSQESEATIKRQEEEEKFYKNAPVNTKKEQGLDDILEAGDWFTAE